MASSNAATPVADLRRALAAEAAATSLRRLSRVVGMSPTGLQKFLDGAHPYSGTRRRLERWYVLYGPGRAPSPLRGPVALAVVRALVQDLPPARHRPAMEALVASMEAAYAGARLPPPRWLGELAAELDRDLRA